MQFSRLDAVAFAHKDHETPFGREVGGRSLLQLGGEDDEEDRLRLLTGIGLDRHAVAERAMHGFIAGAEALGLIVCGTVEEMQGALNEGGGVALFLQKCLQQFGFDVAVVGPAPPVAQIPVAQRLLKELDHPLLGLAFYLADGHGLSVLSFLGFHCQSMAAVIASSIHSERRCSRCSGNNAPTWTSL